MQDVNFLFQVIDGKSKNQLTSLCGNVYSTPHYIEGQSYSVAIIFRSDSSESSRGWVLNWTGEKEAFILNLFTTSTTNFVLSEAPTVS